MVALGTIAWRSVGLVLVIAASPLIPGCLNPCDIHYFTGKAWVEPGLFARFPEDGNVNGYEISNWTRQGVGEVRAGRLEFELQVTNRIEVDENDLAHFTLGREKKLSQADTHAQLNQTFEALGLGEPHPVDWQFKWTDTGC